MIPKIEPQADAQYIYVKKEAFYKGNFISLMCESFFFAFALTMFSPENVLPVYVSSLSDKAIYIALISALYYGISYSATVFSCVVGVNAKKSEVDQCGDLFFAKNRLFSDFPIHIFGQRKCKTGACDIFCFAHIVRRKRRNVEPVVRADGGDVYSPKRRYLLWCV